MFKRKPRNNFALKELCIIVTLPKVSSLSAILCKSLFKFSFSDNISPYYLGQQRIIYKSSNNVYFCSAL